MQRSIINYFFFNYKIIFLTKSQLYRTYIIYIYIQQNIFHIAKKGFTHMGE